MKLSLSPDAIGGLLLIAAAAFAIILDNSGFAPLYDALLNTKGTIAIGEYGLSKPILLWINEGLMAIFFLLVGLEIKREVVTGELSSLKSLALPGLAAVGGMAVPALLFWLATGGDAQAMSGWAIPTATDIAFAIGILAMMGSRVPPELKLFLLTLAILDDLGAVIIIAAFYTADLSVTSLTLAALGCVALFALNRAGIRNTSAYLFIGALVWLAVLKSGVHATLAGVAVGLAIPATKDEEGHSPLEDLEHNLHTPVALMVLPLFAFANAGVSLAGLSVEKLLAPVSSGILAGLAIGKPLGVMAGAMAAVWLFRAKLPGKLTMAHVWGAGHLAGIGFTMSLFIGSLAYRSVELQADVRLGVLAASLLSVLAGWAVLSRAKPSAE
ncbi:Na+/H+ antiporter NhaA [Kordiimonas lipolytica]|uniref:Na(+)/H(+) antiporter NhaA n=1 Tax=Kordiimonas lipolytica TaxID=1662421 RepID=A0ABV8U749_9PROT|nr:Na+/H+ antiporter NhaA [Kordiimonas lipolytica]